jgi:hypothetical protein
MIRGDIAAISNPAPARLTTNQNSLSMPGTPAVVDLSKVSFMAFRVYNTRRSNSALDYRPRGQAACNP